MKKKIAALTVLGVMAAATAHASGYRIPEQSVNAVALSNAYIANSNGPDSAYYNPANMGWQKDTWQLEAGASYINLPSIDYTDSRAANLNGSSETENTAIPMLHVISPNLSNFRFGFSFVVPFGLTKRWDDTFPKTSAEEFTLHVFEGNPSISYTFCDQFSLAVGARILHTTGNKVKSNGIIATPGLGPNTFSSISRNMDGDSTDLGYNLAMTVRPTSQWKVAATFRSKVTMNLKGTATLTSNSNVLGAAAYRGDVSLDVVTPAVLTVSTSYTFDKTTVELTWDKTYWSAYEELDFEYDGTIADPILLAAFDSPVNKDWDDSNAYRIGITHHCTDRLTAMAGLAYDETPIPDDTLGFELPGSDAIMGSLGGKYQVSDHLEVGAAYLYNHKKTRKIKAADANASSIEGKFEDAGAHILTVGMVYTF